MEGFEDSESCLVYLTHIMSGHFYLRTIPRDLIGTKTDSNSMSCWEIHHEIMNPNLGKIKDNGACYFKVFEDNLGLVKKGQKPHSIFIQREIDYDIYLPPIKSISHNSRYES
mmetsp:Transcript_22454/g.23386  ORF Transcript_22454/g.23386 Transcript_22454/m.23386 type:complete len:112 (-) Transcript_22454:30-365(-)